MNIQINNQQSAIPPSARPRQMAGSNQQFAKGFSLTEVLLAVGILAVGMLFIAGVFPVSIHLTTIASERTIAAVVADEAFAKVKLYGLLPSTDANWSPTCQSPFEYVASTQPPADCFAYPSTPTADPYSKRYWWSAVCRRTGVDLNDVQVTVFISRKTGTTTTYPNWIDSSRPIAMDVNVSAAIVSDELTIMDNKTWINDGYTIVDDADGQIYRVLERYPNNDTVIKLDQSWKGVLPGFVWVVPPPVGGGRYPCIAIYQKVVRF